jgi:glucosylceramidase
VGNLCSAPIMVFPAKDSVYFHNSYYYIGHFSRFIKPGAKRVICATTYDELEVTAFKNKNNTIAVIVLNRSERDCPFYLKYKDNSAKTVSKPHSIMTFVFDVK